MNRLFAVALVGIMLLVVIGQAVWLGQHQSQPVVEIRLHESRLLTFLNDIQQDNPATYDSTVLNLARIRDGQTQAQNIQLEETAVAEQLLARLAEQKLPSNR